MDISLRRIQSAEKGLLSTLLVNYFMETDPAKVTHTLDGPELDYPYLDTYWNEPGRQAVFIMNPQEVVGFVLINKWTVEEAFGAEYSIAEFYVRPAFRRQRAGSKAVRMITEQYTGKWEIRQAADDGPAVAFWRSVVNDLSGGDYRETEKVSDERTEIIQLFTVEEAR